MKIFHKIILVVGKKVANVKNEKNVMATVQHPFVIDLVSTFQDDYSVYMVINLAQGGELYQHVQKQPGSKLAKYDAQFYTACALEGLAYLHSLKICHRDVKPENILIGSDGYCIIIDLGFAKEVHDKTFTIVSATFLPFM